MNLEKLNVRILFIHYQEFEPFISDTESISGFYHGILRIYHSATEKFKSSINFIIFHVKSIFFK